MTNCRQVVGANLNNIGTNPAYNPCIPFSLTILIK